MRYESLTTDQAIDILRDEGVIYWTEDGYRNGGGVDWNKVSQAIGTDEIHTFCNGYKTKVVWPEPFVLVD